MSRTIELLNAAADALDDGQDPFHESFLIEHDVTAAECYALSEQLALGARVMAWAIANPAAASAAVNGAHLHATYEAIGRGLDKVLQTSRAAG
ncbi:hypothetical protein [Micromonospora chalcea]|uniref:hypothetical protein n=1 Tax=Micromonospora chalcea TaxID=1874 RepID=UPI003D708D4C